MELSDLMEAVAKIIVPLIVPSADESCAQQSKTATIIQVK